MQVEPWAGTAQTRAAQTKKRQAWVAMVGQKVFVVATDREKWIAVTATTCYDSQDENLFLSVISQIFFAH